MSTEDKKTDNELIAEFMGLERTKSIWDKGEYAYTIKFESFGYFNKWVIPSDMEFQTSWNWLMPVVEKIYNTPAGRFHSDGQIAASEVMFQLSQLSIIRTFNACVEFIKWYNQQPK